MTLAPEPLAGRMHLRPGVAPPAAIHSTRPDLLPRLAPGRRAGEMPALLGAVFTLCAAAHRLTAIAAIRAARGEPADDPAAAAQTLRLATAREQILRIGHDWPRLLRQDGRSDEGALLLRTCPLWRDDLPPADRLEALPVWLAHKWLGHTPADWLQRHDADPTGWATRWVEQTVRFGTPGALVRLLHQIGPAARTLATPGRSLRPAASDWALLGQAMADDPAFCAHPHWHGQPADTGPWSRRADVDASTPPLDGTVWLRLVARLVEVLRLGASDGADRLDHGACALGRGAGLAWCETARGLLVHRVQLDADGQRVQAWQVLAPTEWNFHPAGTLAHALAALRDTDPAQRDAAARLLAVAFDPCVEFEVRHA